MIMNIVDRRKRPYRWARITAIAEATWHDNSVKDSDRDVPDQAGVAYAEMPECTVWEAINWVEAMSGKNTLYLYDLGDGISERSRK